jgi:DNA-directed RNA polymerase specialized sigma24 family protein
MTFEELILQHRGHILQVVRDLGRRHHLAAAEREEFEGRAFHALERNDFELLRAFDGRSTWNTYLTLVVTREFHAYQALLWGSWRPSAVARRLGPAGVLLEELVRRDGLTLEDAFEVMRSGHRVDLPRYRLLHAARVLGLSDSTRLPPVTNDAPDDEVIQGLLQGLLAQLPPEDRLMLTLRYRDGQPLTTVARVLQRDVRPVERRLEQVEMTLRRALAGAGIPEAHVQRVLQPAAVASAHRWWETVLPRPSK